MHCMRKSRKLKEQCGAADCSAQATDKTVISDTCKACTDKRLKYVRYADDFLIAVNGTREECEAIKAKLTDFVRDTLKMELSQEKTLITHSNTPARFLGFDVRVRRDASVKRSGKRKCAL